MLKIPEKKLTIAVDGYSSCGKSTFAKAIAAELKYIYIDTGAMYRAVTLFALQHNMFVQGILDTDRLRLTLNKIQVRFVKNPSSERVETWLNGTNVEAQIRGMEVSNCVSLVSQVKEVRQKMVEIQREMGKEKGVVMDGRDIGTVVFPDADIKLFMTASPQVRAQRRFDELQEKGEKASFEEIFENLQQRDYIDTHREESPLTQAPDAIILDNSNMTPAEQMVWFNNLLSEF
jgi:cytidylate kinase